MGVHSETNSPISFTCYKVILTSTYGTSVSYYFSFDSKHRGKDCKQVPSSNPSADELMKEPA